MNRNSLHTIFHLWKSHWQNPEGRCTWNVAALRRNGNRAGYVSSDWKFWCEIRRNARSNLSLSSNANGARGFFYQVYRNLWPPLFSWGAVTRDAGITLYKTSRFNSAGMAQCKLTLRSLKRRERRGEKEMPLPYLFPSQHDFLLWPFHLSILISLSADEPGSLPNNIPEGRWGQYFLFPVVLFASPVHS